MKNRWKRFVSCLSLTIVGIILVSNLTVSAQTSNLGEQNQCSVSPVQIKQQGQKIGPDGKPLAGSNSSVEIQEAEIPLLVSSVSVPSAKDAVNEAALGDRIRVKIDGLEKAINNGYFVTFDQDRQRKIFSPFNYNNLVLQLDGYSMNDVHGTYISPSQLEFKLANFNDSKEAWNGIFGNALNAKRDVLVSVGCPDGQTIASSRRFEITILLWQSLRGFIILVPLIILFASIVLCFKSNLLRGSGITNSRAYSLGRSQLAWWSYLILFSFLALFAITGSYTNILTNQSIILLGVGAATTLGSSIIDSNQSRTLTLEQIAKLMELDEKKQKMEAELRVIKNPKDRFILKRALKTNIQEMDKYEVQSRGFIQDLVTGANGEINLHRYQIFIWTIILGSIFIYEVITSFKMPEFDTTLLALQGISAGTFLTLKAQVETPREEVIEEVIDEAPSLVQPVLPQHASVSSQFHDSTQRQGADGTDNGAHPHDDSNETPKRVLDPDA